MSDHFSLKTAQKSRTIQAARKKNRDLEKRNNAENLLSDWHFAEGVLKPRFPHGIPEFVEFFHVAKILVAALVVNVAAVVWSFMNLSAIFLEGRGWTTFGQEILKNWLIVGLTFFRKCWNGRGKKV